MNKEERKRLRLGCVEDCLPQTEKLIRSGASDDEVAEELICEECCITSVIYLIVREKVPSLAITILKVIPREVLEDLEAKHFGEMSELIFKYGSEVEKKEFSLFLTFTSPALSLKFLRGTRVGMLPKEALSGMAATIVQLGTSEEIRSTISHYENGGVELPDGAYEMLQEKVKVVA